MHKQELILENETHENVLDVEIKMDHLISARIPDLMLIKKEKKNLSCWFFHSTELKRKKRNKAKVS